ncbi:MULTISPECIES: metallophosphoesterase [unclassified Paenibacillus]|uniref:metallophosphoesterase n=1 Tax=unclassified Paenibacillus TaxID=185978 RepID=UPI0024062F7B|nr:MULTISPECIES: metallophosphoesterase [unclassified Paenibacillus]MDF9839177.1 putative MPP superfamily phosphohydrolase [Paenibacillus sp. PastF-2]MDF9845759.1 putative MPP superfamily phosphohydrolase [Paenibacillus sp. PastM-2]MDF9852331.1 putative MPP superfamily phosphohydrolase [Paenibacillus sp. PastF-1]MDH6477939.1 putative MPP superfamily phosphohydrolase [Paenibacillus sp. PastH-2]MDH6505677.1 putative MPP superfamily phosphohydrolase [Paenibacillus sp. PastM-3]
MKNLRMLLSGAVMLLVLGLVNFYIGYHLWVLLKDVLPGILAGVYWTVFMLIAFAYMIGMIPWPKAVKPGARLFKVIGSYYLACMEFAVITLPLTDLLYWVLGLMGFDRNAFTADAGITLVVLLAVFLIWGSRNAWSTVVRTHPVRIDKSIGTSVPLTVAVASDLHLGNIVGNRHLRKMVAEINRMKPDIILLAGDVLDDSIEPFIRNNMSLQMKQLKARYGVYAVLGNHEYYGGSIAQYTELMAGIGIKVLQDEVVEAGGVYIAGRKDKTAESMQGGRMSVSALLEGLDHSRPILMMDHQPTGFDIAAKAGVDVLLSGHTHRGQIAPNHWITRRLFELDWGYLLKDKLHVIVSSGYGTWGPPIRLASRSELIRLEVLLEGSKSYQEESLSAKTVLV